MLATHCYSQFNFITYSTQKMQTKPKKERGKKEEKKEKEKNKEKFF